MLIYAFDCWKSQYLWGNLGYNGSKIHLKQAFSEKALEWKENEARKGTPEYQQLGGYMASDMVEIWGTCQKMMDDVLLAGGWRKITLGCILVSCCNLVSSHGPGFTGCHFSRWLGGAHTED